MQEEEASIGINIFLARPKRSQSLPRKATERIGSDSEEEKGRMNNQRVKGKRKTLSFSENRSLELHKERQNNPELRFRKELETEKSTKRLYELWKGNNIFCLFGRCITGPRRDIKYMLLTWGIIAILTIVYGILALPTLAQGLTIIFPCFSAMLLLLSIIFFLLTTFSDPGIIPRREIFELCGNVPDQYTTKLLDILPLASSSLSQEEKNRVLQSYKFCSTCKILRPPRASHCAYCDNCIEVFDHHCPFVGNCVGKRNYRYFVVFLISLVLYGFSVIAGLVILGFTGGEDTNLIDNKVILLIIIIALGLAMLALLSLAVILLIYHLILVWKGETTKENLTSKNHRFGQKLPYPRADICYSDPPLVDYRAIVDEEKYRKFLAGKQEAQVQLPLSQESPKHKNHTESDNPIRLNSSLANRLRNLNNPVKDPDRVDLSHSGSNFQFIMKKKQQL